MDVPLPAVERMKQGLMQWEGSQSWLDFRVGYHPRRGRCLVAKRFFSAGEFVLEYEGQFISAEECLRREKIYREENIGCFVVSATWQGRPVCIDGTLNFGSMGRLVNHARGGNVKPFRLLQLEPDQPPRLALFAARAIHAGEELFWDYGIRAGDTNWASFRCPANPTFKQGDSDTEHETGIEGDLVSEFKDLTTWNYFLTEGTPGLPESDETISSACDLKSGCDSDRICVLTPNQKSSFESDINFCPDCGSILPLPGAEDFVRCYTCPYRIEITAYDGIEMKTRVVFNRRTKARTTTPEEIFRPLVDRPCAQCGRDSVELSTCHVRSAQEGQTLFYHCLHCGHKEQEES